MPNCARESIAHVAREHDELSLRYICEGSNTDDNRDYRPGHRAIAELGIRSPLRDCGFSKADIRELSRQLNLPTAEKPSFACLSSRFVYGETITEQKLRMVEKRDQILAAFKKIGFTYISLDLQGFRTGSMNETLLATERSTAAI